ncbi:hypothetical protein GCM10020255_002600 [Rhodococcus baikonurensis]
MKIVAAVEGVGVFDQFKIFEFVVHEAGIVIWADLYWKGNGWIVVGQPAQCAHSAKGDAHVVLRRDRVVPELARRFDTIGRM